MTLYCDRCGSEMHPLSAYCFYCAAPAQARTVFGDFSEPVYENGTHCPVCGKHAPEDAAFCGSCRESLFKKPLAQSVFCPVCGEKNNADALLCTRCRGSFSDWFSMKGHAAHKMGCRGDLLLKEKMTEIRYEFITGEHDKIITFGRSPKNRVMIPCGWVSSDHGFIDLETKALTDKGSSNGTFINRTSQPITTVGLHDIREFNVSGSFTFSVVNKPGAFIFRLSAILDEEECRKNGDPQGYERLRKIYYILVFGDVSIHIRKQDGMIEATRQAQYDYYTITIEDGFYYYSDKKRDIENRLLFSKKANWPVNWEM